MGKNITPDLLPDPGEGVEGVSKLISALRHDASLVPSLRPVELREAAQLSYENAIKWVFVFVTALNLLYLAVCWPVEEYELSDKPATWAERDDGEVRREEQDTRPTSTGSEA